MNMPNLASCHQAIRAARVAACLDGAGAAGVCPPAGESPCNANALVSAAVRAKAPAAPSCFKNDRLVFSFQSMGVSLLVKLATGFGADSRRGEYTSHTSSLARALNIE